MRLEKEKKKRRVLNGSMEPCVHTLGTERFSEWLEGLGIDYVSIKLGPAIGVDELINKIRESNPEVVSVSYRLGDLHVDELITELIEKAHAYGLESEKSGIRWCFGATRPAANLVRAMTSVPIKVDKFSPPEDRHFDLEEITKEYSTKQIFRNFFELIVDDYVTMEELEYFAVKKSLEEKEKKIKWSDELIPRIKQVRELENRPIIRAHIGVAADTIEPTVAGVRKLSDEGAIEIVSLAPDQASQAFLAKFIRGEEDPAKHSRGQGGVPISGVEDLKKLKEATQCGNFPMSRIYSGTDELYEVAQVFQDTLNMAFPAVPIFFYNCLDGRGPLSIMDGFYEHYRVIKWWASIDKPLEINDPHQWQLRRCSDDMYVTDHILCAIIALKMGIKNYVMQLMFDLPPEIYPMYDLAKMKAAYEIIAVFKEHFDFNIIKETRGGLSSYPPNLNEAKGHHAISTYWQMFMEPEIVHAVCFSEAHHEAKDDDIIETAEITKQIFKEFERGHMPDIWNDPKVIKRKEELKKGAMYNILHLALMGGYEGKITPENFFEYAVSKEEAAARKNKEDQEKHYETMLLDLISEENYPIAECGMISPDTLDLGLQIGLFQAPQVTVIDRRYELSGKCRTKIVDGTCRIDSYNGIPVKDEFERVDIIRKRYPWYFNKNVSAADDVSFISELEEKVDESVVESFRRQVGVTKLSDINVLSVDFGSTFTKIVTFNTKSEEIDLKFVPTTIEDLRKSLANGLGVLADVEKAGSWKPLDDAIAKFDLRLPCSSAKGGLKMVTVSLTSADSGFAAETAALTAGAKLVNTYFGRLSEEDGRRIYEIDEPEIILLAGGTNSGGESKTQIHNARILAETARYVRHTKYGVPVIYTGNEDIAEEIVAIFKEKGVDVRVVGNIMPEVNTYAIENVNETIRELFQTVIIRAKGFDVVEEYMSAKFIPTPRAAFLGVNLLARGFGDEPGIGPIIALDVGGATTDFYSNVLANPLYRYPWDDFQKRQKRTILKTPNVPLAYRRVEGKFGLAYNAENMKELERYKNGLISQELVELFSKQFPEPAIAAQDPFARFVKRNGKRYSIDLDNYLIWIRENPHELPITQEESWVRAFLTKEVMRITTLNNVGHARETDVYFLQHGVNFLDQKANLLLIGGAIYGRIRENRPGKFDDLSLIAGGALFNPEEYTVLRPNGDVLLDANYIVSTVGGLYGRFDPERALKMLKKYLIKFNGGGSMN